MNIIKEYIDIQRELIDLRIYQDRAKELRKLIVELYPPGKVYKIKDLRLTTSSWTQRSFKLIKAIEVLGSKLIPFITKTKRYRVDIT